MKGSVMKKISNKSKFSIERILLVVFFAIMLTYLALPQTGEEDSLYKEAEYYLNIGYYDSAIKTLKKLLEINPKSAAAYSSLGNAFSFQGKYEQAILMYKKCIEIDSTYIFKPVNIFTPNNDGINDVFTFKKYASNIREFYCTIINRWGVIVGEFEGINNSWDGKDLSGSQCTDGVYFYTYQAETYGGYKFNGQGTVQIIGTGVGN